MRLFKFIQRKSALGDVLWTEPVVRRLAQDYYRVIVITPYADLFENYPLKNVLFRKKLHPLLKIVREISKALFGSSGFIDLDMVYERSPNMHILRAYFNKAGYPAEPLSCPKIYLSEKEMLHTETTRTVVLHLFPPSAQKNYRTIAGIDWILVKNYLEERNYRVIGITDSTTEGPLYTTSCNPALRELIVLIKKCSFFIGLDSGPSHIAAALKKPSIIFFGSVNPAYRHILEEFNGIIMQQKCPHAGCYHTTSEMIDRRCLLVDDTKPALCCTFTTQDLLTAIERIQQPPELF
jgi:ADP-heptose:LPS heptosyltransferase